VEPVDQTVDPLLACALLRVLGPTGAPDAHLLFLPAQVGEELGCTRAEGRAGQRVADLQEYAGDRGLPPHKRPSRLTLMEDLPRTAAGKVRKRDLRHL